jgi:hypothetical protein
MQITLAMDSLAESVSAETLNISKSGAYFATSRKLREGVKLELRLKIPEKIKSFRPLNAKLTGPRGPRRGPRQQWHVRVGVHFLHYCPD